MRPNIRVAIVSDTHGFLDPRVAEVAGACDIAVHAGDILSAAALRLLQPRSGEVYAVRGNNDIRAKWAWSEHAVLAKLPEQQDLELPGGVVTVEHGHRIWDTRNYHMRLRNRHPHVRAIIYGHRQVCDVTSRPWVLNPGAAGRVYTHGGPSCLILHAGLRRWRVEAMQFEPLPSAACSN